MLCPLGKYVYFSAAKKMTEILISKVYLSQELNLSEADDAIRAVAPVGTDHTAVITPNYSIISLDKISDEQLQRIEENLKLIANGNKPYRAE